jgi:hypothetical protein
LVFECIQRLNGQGPFYFGFPYQKAPSFIPVPLWKPF